MTIQEIVINNDDNESVVSAINTPEDSYEETLRPLEFTDFIGQKEVVDNLIVFAKAAKTRNEYLDHTLLYGPPGLGKTTLSMILARVQGKDLKIASGPTLDKTGDLVAILSQLQEGDVLFIDEIHRLRKPLEEILYTALEDFAIDIILGKGATARTMRLSLPRFTLIGATTKISMLSSPLRDRFGHIEKLRYYEHNEIISILKRSAHILKITIDSDALDALAPACRRTPRIANRLLKRMRDFAEVLYNTQNITKELVYEGLIKLSVDKNGLDYNDQLYIKQLLERFNGGPVGLMTLASSMSEEPHTLEDIIEPYLLREGFITKTPRGRALTAYAYTYLGIHNHTDNTLL